MELFQVTLSAVDYEIQQNLEKIKPDQTNNLQLLHKEVINDITVWSIPNLITLSYLPNGNFECNYSREKPTQFSLDPNYKVVDTSVQVVSRHNNTSTQYQLDLDRKNLATQFYVDPNFKNCIVLYDKVEKNIYLIQENSGPVYVYSLRYVSAYRQVTSVPNETYSNVSYFAKFSPILTEVSIFPRGLEYIRDIEVINDRLFIEGTMHGTNVKDTPFYLYTKNKFKIEENFNPIYDPFTS